MSNTVLPQIPSTISTRPATSGTIAPSASSTAAPQQNDSGNNQVSFYRNLFYILIAVLGFFALASILSLLRARRRRKVIRAEAERLGVLVPGMDGYIPIRERQNMRGTPAGGVPAPKWWEIGSAGWMNQWNLSNKRPGLSRGYSSIGGAGGSHSEKGHLGLGFSALSTLPTFQNEKKGIDQPESLIEFQPLAVIPPTPHSYDALNPAGPNINNATNPRFTRSEIKFFPSHLAYRPLDLLPPPPVWEKAGPVDIENLRGGKVDMVTMIRMPEPEATTSARAERRGEVDDVGEDEDEDGQEVLREWGGVCLGVVSIDIDGGNRGELVNGERNGKARDAW